MRVPRLLFSDGFVAQVMRAAFFGHVEGCLYDPQTGETIYDEVLIDLMRNEAKSFKCKPRAMGTA